MQDGLYEHTLSTYTKTSDTQHFLAGYYYVLVHGGAASNSQVWVYME